MRPLGIDAQVQASGGRAGLPPLCDASASFAAELEVRGEHVCSRFCRISHQFGNLYRCETSGTVHICDMNCNQRIFYDNHSQICRLSRRVFQNADVDMAAEGRCTCPLLPGRSAKGDSPGSPLRNLVAAGDALIDRQRSRGRLPEGRLPLALTAEVSIEYSVRLLSAADNPRSANHWTAGWLLGPPEAAVQGARKRRVERWWGKISHFPSHW